MSRVWTFGIDMLVDGVFVIGAAIGGRRRDGHGGMLLLEGLPGIGLGVLTVLMACDRTARPVQFDRPARLS